jgi:hypothetical protein
MIQLAALREEMLRLRELAAATENPALLQAQIERMNEVAIEVGFLDLPPLARERETPELFDGEESADELRELREARDDARAAEMLFTCPCCGETSTELGRTFCCSDDFPEPGDIRETGR